MATTEFVKYDGGQTPPFRASEAGDTLPPARLPLATTTDPGAMSAADKAKLNGIEAGATADQTAAEVPFTPTGGIAATNVQDAIAEVAAEAGSGSGNVTGPGLVTEDNIATYGNAANEIKDGGTKVSTLTAATAAAQSTANSAASSISAHAAASAPHGGHEQTANKNAPSGYAGLSAGLLAVAQIPDVTTSTKGAMLAADKVKLDGVAAGAAALTSDAPSQVGSSNVVGDDTTAARADHVHAHGNQGGGSLHQAADGSTPGFMPAASVTKLAGIESGAQVNKAASLGNGVAVLSGISGDGTLQVRSIQGAPSSPTIVCSVLDGAIQFQVGTNSLGHTHITDDAIRNQELANMASGTLKGRISSGTGDPEDLNQTQSAELVLGTSQPSTLKGVPAGGAAAVASDLTAPQARRILVVEPAAGAGFSRVARRTEPDDIPSVKRTMRRLAGVAPITNLTNTHGSTGHLYPYVTPGAVNFNGHPHMDDDRMGNNTGQSLAQNVGCSAVSAGLAKFTLASGTWPAGWGTTNWAVSMDFDTPAHNGYWDIDSVSGADLFVLDPLGLIGTEAAAAHQEVRAVSNRSGFNGYLEGLPIPAGTLRAEQRIRFGLVGYVENTAASSRMLEFILEPDPEPFVYDGANLVSMATMAFGATWTGKRPMRWRCDLWRGVDPTDYYVDWRLRIDGIVDLRGTAMIEGGPDADAERVTWCPRWRVDDETRLAGPFDGTYQGPSAGLLCESHYYEHGRVA